MSCQLVARLQNDPYAVERILLQCADTLYSLQRALGNPDFFGLISPPSIPILQVFEVILFGLGNIWLNTIGTILDCFLCKDSRSVQVVRLIRGIVCVNLAFWIVHANAETCLQGALPGPHDDTAMMAFGKDTYRVWRVLLNDRLAAVALSKAGSGV